MKLVITPKTFLEIGKGNVAIRNLVTNRQKFGLELYAPERFQIDIDTLKGNAFPAKKLESKAFKRDLEKFLKEIKIIPREVYTGMLREVEQNVREAMYVEYIALAKTLPVDGIWDDSPAIKEIIPEMIQITTPSLYARSQKVLHILATEIKNLNESITVRLSDTFGPVFANHVQEVILNWLIREENKILNLLPELNKVIEVKVYEVQYATNTEYGINIITLSKGVLNELKNQVTSKEDQYQEIIKGLAFFTRDCWEFPEKPKVFGSHPTPKGGGDIDFPLPSVTGQIFIPNDVLGYDVKRFIEEYLSEEPPASSLDELKKIYIIQSQLKPGASFLDCIVDQGDGTQKDIQIPIDPIIDELRKERNQRIDELIPPKVKF